MTPAQVRPSSIHGLGLFALEQVAAGTPIWRFVAGFDHAFPTHVMESFPPHVQHHIRWFAYFDQERLAWILSGDHTCFMNHSDTPNTGVSTSGMKDGETITVALTDIPVGAELTCDYRAFDAEAAAKLG